MTLNISNDIAARKAYSAPSVLVYDIDEVSKRNVYKGGGVVYHLVQFKNDKCTRTELYKNNELVRTKNNINSLGIVREHFKAGESIAYSFIPKPGSKDNLFYFMKNIDNKEPLHNVMSGWFNGKNVLKVNSFDIAKYIGEQTFWELGGSSRYYFKKILGYLNKF